MYINNDEMKWHAAIGIPYGMHLWQVGDSSEQNGVFKMELVCQKQFVLEKKMEIGLDFKLEKKDIIGMVRRAFPLAFGNVENNKKATAGCGWNLLNWVLLDHPDIWTTEEQHEDTAACQGIKQAYEQLELSGLKPPNINDLNTKNGLAGTAFDKIVTAKIQQTQRDQSYGKDGWEWCKKAAEERMNKTGHVTAGIYFAFSETILSNKELQQRVQMNY